jgi:hypothetical protein
VSTKADSNVVVVWWLWVVTALLALPLPIQWAFAVTIRGLDSVFSEGIGGDGFAILSVSALLTLVTSPLLLIISPLYAFLFWSRRRQGVRLSARFWIPLYGSALLAAMLSLMVLSVLAGTRRENAVSDRAANQLQP